MNQKICVYTCITGDYDNLNEIEHPEKGIDYYCFTNNQSLKSKTWKIIQIRDDKLDNCRLARKIKVLGHPTINDHYDVALWTDASVVWQKPISEFIAKYFKNQPFSIFKHSCRSSVHDEAIACLLNRKDSKDAIVKTLKYLEQNQYPDTSGLHESTVFIRILKDPQVMEMAKVWFSVIENYSRRDQLSFDYAVWKTKLKIKTINFNIWNNPWFTHQKHNTPQEISHCGIYYGDPDHDFDFSKYYFLKYSQDKDKYTISTNIPVDCSEIYLLVANYPGLEYKDFRTNLSFKNIKFVNLMKINNKLLFNSSYSAVRLYGDFKCNQKFSFSLNLTPISNFEFIDLLNQLWSENLTLINQNDELKYNYQVLSDQLSSTKQNLENIINSKGWRTLEKLRKVTPHKKL